MIDTPNLLESYNRCFPQTKTTMTPLSKALARGNGQAAQKLMQDVEYNLQERWQITVFKNLDFNDEEFLLLSPETQSLIYRTANNFNNIPLVARLNTLGKYTIDVPVTKPCILSMRMDIATTYQILSAYLVKLRQENRLLTETEFQAFQSNDAWRKKSDFTRILGRDYILQLIEEKGLQHVKVPEKKVVIHSNKETFSLEISQYGSWELVRMESNDISIYVQNIQKMHRFLSREEMTELFIVLDAANFTDLWANNFIVAEDGIYFIDTEIKSFDYLMMWDKMQRLSCFMAEADQAWFIKQIGQKCEDQACTKQKFCWGFRFAELVLETIKEIAQEKRAQGITDITISPKEAESRQFIKQYKLVGADRFLTAYNARPFSFSVQDLLKQEKVDFKAESDTSSSNHLAHLQ